MDDFLLRALMAGAAVALVAGPLGCFIVWRRMAYFGDALAHSALLGIVAGLLLGVAPLVGVVALCVIAAVILSRAEADRSAGGDSLLGILAHGSLALGLVLLSLMDRVRVDLMGWLFGDILAVTASDMAWLWGGGAVVLAVLGWQWRSLIAAAVDEDLAVVEGHKVARSRMLLMLLVALGVAAAMKVVGVMLVTAMLIIPAAAARRLSRTPERMAVLAALAGLIAVALGLGGSWVWDIPSGPSIVTVATALFLLSRTISRR
ncbi:iron chelate uptake ABC transporter family permease subunit [Paramagnetospirillum magneticum]|uniref:High-affinity zinc uptake system membrane protein ZnuB n=1 Tax=Paramagnetospirillum magneticum (strain ATCC 700264 / AMB-1) TaxID=342108 RepID=Q2W4W0_PARM1|nr:iron chelate uptake ABC transporter family permease subunit [Paramagnetospirillum magneticum]BAE51115.1 ABC-type Mn2+/Zn2+ transport systems, permease components [Paramagnetospirillum magneticum AMB-1]